jgi:hypothetical protein
VNSGPSSSRPVQFESRLITSHRRSPLSRLPHRLRGVEVVRPLVLLFTMCDPCHCSNWEKEREEARGMGAYKTWQSRSGNSPGLPRRAVEVPTLPSDTIPATVILSSSLATLAWLLSVQRLIPCVKPIPASCPRRHLQPISLS